MGSSSRSEEHTSELQSPCNLVCRLLLEKKNDILEAVDAFRIQRDPFFAELLHAGEALLPVNVDPVLALRFRTVFQLSSASIHISPALVDRPKRRRIEGHEEVSHVRLLLVRVDLQSRRGSAQHAAEDVDHERQAVSLVTAELLAFAAQRQEAAA